MRINKWHCIGVKDQIVLSFNLNLIVTDGLFQSYLCNFFLRLFMYFEWKRK